MCLKINIFNCFILSFYHTEPRFGTVLIINMHNNCSKAYVKMVQVKITPEWDRNRPRYAWMMPTTVFYF